MPEAAIFAEDEVPKTVLADVMERQLDRAGNDEDEHEDLGGMDERRHKHALALLAAAPAMGAQLIDAELDAALPEHLQYGVHREAHRNARHDLHGDDLEEKQRRHLLGDEHGDQFVRGGEKHGDERAGRNRAAGVERGRRRRKAALRKDARQRTEERPETTGAPEPTLERTFRPRLQHLKHQIGDEEKRQEQEIV